MHDKKWTPGPWRISEIIPYCKSAMWVKAKEGHDAIESQTSAERLINIHSTTKHMNNVYGSCEGGHIAELLMTYGEEGRQQALFNARLMAAAPDLYDALEGLLDNYKEKHGQGIGLGPIMKAKKALAKARGEDDV